MNRWGRSFDEATEIRATCIAGVEPRCFFQSALPVTRWIDDDRQRDPFPTVISERQLHFGEQPGAFDGFPNRADWAVFPQST